MKVMKPSFQRRSTEFVIGPQQKQITSFKSFKNEVDNNTYSIGVIRERGQQSLRVALINMNNAEIFISKQTTFNKIKNPNYLIDADSKNNSTQFRNDILSALAVPDGNNSKYCVIVMNNTANRNGNNFLQIEIFKTANEIKVKLGTIKVYRNQNELKHREYFYKKLEATLVLMGNEKQNLLRQNKELQSNYDKSQKVIKEAIAKTNNLELELMQKFVNILNTKKEKIRKLQNEIELLKKCKTTCVPSKSVDVDRKINENKNYNQKNSSLKFRKKQNKSGDGYDHKIEEKRIRIKNDEFSLDFMESVATMNHNNNFMEVDNDNEQIKEIKSNKNRENEEDKANASTKSVLDLYLNSIDRSYDDSVEIIQTQSQQNSNRTIFQKLHKKNIEDDQNQKSDSNGHEMDIDTDKQKNANMSKISPTNPRKRHFDDLYPSMTTKATIPEETECDLPIGSHPTELHNESFIDLKSQIEIRKSDLELTLYQPEEIEMSDNEKLTKTQSIGALSSTEEYEDDQLSQTPNKKRKTSDLLSFPLF